MERLSLVLTLKVLYFNFYPHKSPPLSGGALVVVKCLLGVKTFL